MSELKLLVQRIGLVGILNVLISFNSIILLPILTKSLSIQDYGIYVQFTTTLGLFPLFVTLGLSYTMVRFLAAEKNIDKIREGFYTIALIISFVGIIVSLFMYLISDTTATYIFNNNITIAHLLPFVLLINCLNIPLFAFFRTFQKIKLYSILSLINNYLNLFLISYAALAGYGIVGVAFGLFIGQLIITLILYYLILKKIGFRFPKFINLKKYLAFGLPTLPGNISTWIVDLSDRYLVGIILGISFVGYYAPAYNLGTIILAFIGPLSFMLPVSLSKSYDENKKKDVKITLNYSLKYFLMIAIPAAFGISLLSKPILLLLSTPDIALNGYLVTPFVTLSTIFYGLYGIISNVLVLKLKTKIIGFSWIIAAIINFILNLLLIPHYGLIGSAFATLISYFLVFVIILIFTMKDFKFDFNFGFVIKSILSSIIMGLLILFLYPNNIIGLLTIVILSIIVYFVILFILKGFNDNEIKFFKSLLNK